MTKPLITLNVSMSNTTEFDPTESEREKEGEEEELDWIGEPDSMIAIDTKLVEFVIDLFNT